MTIILSGVDDNCLSGVDDNRQKTLMTKIIPFFVIIASEMLQASSSKCIKIKIKLLINIESSKLS